MRTRKDSHYVPWSGMMFSMALAGYQSNNNVAYSSKYHVVWAPKYRRPVLVGAIAKRCERLTMCVFSVRLILSSAHRLVKNIKGASSHSLRKEFSVLRSRLPTLWIKSYFVPTVGGAPLAVIQQYVEKQKNV